MAFGRKAISLSFTTSVSCITLWLTVNGYSNLYILKQQNGTAMLPLNKSNTAELMNSLTLIRDNADVPVKYGALTNLC